MIAVQQELIFALSRSISISAILESRQRRTPMTPIEKFLLVVMAVCYLVALIIEWRTNR